MEITRKIKGKILSAVILVILLFVAGIPADVSAATATTVNFSATSLTFGSQLVGTSSGAQFTTLTNTGSATLTFSAVVSGDFAFGGVGTCGSSVAPGASCTISVKFTPTAAGTRTGTLTLTDNTGNSPQTISLTGIGSTTSAVAPSITTQPASRTVTAGQTAAFTVVATGTTPLGYQWKKNETAVSGATSSSYTTPATTSSDNGAQFTVTVSNSAGSVTSNAATLTVSTVSAPKVSLSATSLTFGSQAVGTSSVVRFTTLTNTGNATLTFSAVVSGDFAFGGVGTCGSSVAAGASCTISVKFTPTTTGTRTGAVTLTDNAGNSPQTISLTGIGSTTSAVAPSITTQPASRTVTAGQTAGFTVAATGTAPLTYQWKKNGTAISGATSSSYTTPATTSSDNGAQFTVVVSNSAGSITSNPATLTVSAAAVAPSITTQPVSQTVTAGQTAAFTVAATGTAPLTYQWKKNGTAVSGATSSSYTTPATTSSDNGAQFTVAVSDSAGSVTSNTATLTVNPSASTACGATGSGVCHYVSPTGSDSNAGTSAAPFLTIQHAANVVNPGDMVIVRDGTYNNPAISGVGSKLIIMTRGGTVANHVVFIAEHKWGAKIDGLKNTSATGWEFSANYIDVKNFECEGFSDTCMENYNGGSSSGGQFISITGNNIHDVGRYCATTTTGRDGIFISNDNVTIEGNQIHDIGRYAPGENGCVSPLYYQNNDHGIYVDGAFTSANNLTIKNNVFYRNERGWSIQIYPAAVNNLRILNNTFLCANPYRDGHITLSAPLTNSAIENNISWQPTTGFLLYTTTSGYSGLSVANNLTYQGTVGVGSTPGGIALAGNLDDIDPRIVSAPSCTVDAASIPDAHLQLGSPAIDMGLTLLDVPTDYDGTARPQGIRFDLGAFEYHP